MANIKAGTVVFNVAANTVSAKRSLLGFTGAAAGGFMAAQVAMQGFQAAAQFVSESVSMFHELELTMADVRKRSGLTTQQIGLLTEQLKDMSAETAVAANDLAEIASTASQLGLKGSKEILDFTEVVTKMSIATVLSSEEAATAFGKLATAFDLTDTARGMKKELEGIGSAINMLENTTAANSAEIIDSMRRMIAGAVQLGVAVEDTAAISATLIASGVRARRAGTRMNRVFTTMATKADELGEQMGITGEEMAKAIDEAPITALENYLRSLKSIESPTARMSAIIEIFGVAEAKNISILANKFGDLASNMAIARIEMARGISLEKEFGIVMDTDAKKVARLSNEWDNFKIMVGAAVSDQIGPMADAIRNVNALIEEQEIKLAQANKAGKEYNNTLGLTAIVAKQVILNTVGLGFNPITAMLDSFNEEIGESAEKSREYVAASKAAKAAALEETKTREKLRAEMLFYGGVIGKTEKGILKLVGSQETLTDSGKNIVDIYKEQIAITKDELATDEQRVKASDKLIEAAQERNVSEAEFIDLIHKADTVMNGSIPLIEDYTAEYEELAAVREQDEEEMYQQQQALRDLGKELSAQKDVLQNYKDQLEDVTNAIRDLNEPVFKGQRGAEDEIWNLEQQIKLREYNITKLSEESDERELAEESLDELKEKLRRLQLGYELTYDRMRHEVEQATQEHEDSNKTIFGGADEVIVKLKEQWSMEKTLKEQISEQADVIEATQSKIQDRIDIIDDLADSVKTLTDRMNDLSEAEDSVDYTSPPSGGGGGGGGSTPSTDWHPPMVITSPEPDISDILEPPGGWLGLPFQTGGVISKTGTAILHAGETVLPATGTKRMDEITANLARQLDGGRATTTKQVTINVTFENVNGTGEDIAREFMTELRRMEAV